MATPESVNQELRGGVDKLFNQRDSFIVIGLTGRTGSGCSTAAKILASEFSSISLPPITCPMKDNEGRKYGIIREWATKHWQPFTVINVSSIIFAHLCMVSEGEFRGIVEKKCDSSDFAKLLGIVGSVKEKLEKHKIERYKSRDNEDIDEIRRAYNFYYIELPKLTQDFKEEISLSGASVYTDVMQSIGDDIRTSGVAGVQRADHNQIYTLPEFLNNLIKLGRRYSEIEKRPGYFVIDAIRNPFEVEFFRGRYSAFYLFAITTDEACRKRRLHAMNYTDENIKKISEKEYPEKDNLKGYNILVSQHIGKCLEQADIIVENPDSGVDGTCEPLSISIVKYVSLIQHPGLISPNRVERCMQVAITAKLSSGCISRQVGAVVTDENFSIRAIGWNSTAEGQVPCNLRNVMRLKDRSDANAFSDFERNSSNEEFKTEFNELTGFIGHGHSIEGRPLSYCFKSLYNKATGERNQVFTRALHAEENAFMQIAKYDGQNIKGGVLFSTASPCELCSKKAYQLGISNIYYIDPYPGIAKELILSCGDNRPKLHLFTGAIGRAYVQLYQPLVPFKDELEAIMAVNNSSNSQ